MESTTEAASNSLLSVDPFTGSVEISSFLNGSDDIDSISSVSDDGFVSVGEGKSVVLESGEGLNSGMCLRDDGDYFENLPDDLVVFIFTKLSCSCSNGNNFLEDLKTLEYKPRSYCLALVSYKKSFQYFDKDQQFPDPQSLMLPVSARDNEYYESIKSHTRDMICLHHMLVSSIKDHKYLQRVVVTDLNNRGTLTLEEDTLAELRNCTSTNLDQVQARHRSGSLINLDVPLWKNHIGIVLNHICFSIIEWWDKTMDDHTHKDDDDGGSPNALPGNYFITKALTSILENPAKVEVDDNKDILQLLSDLKCDGNLL
ncbi:hypothetical protein POM88_038523 [Heracleum sosnowskyi]|uniref:F-box protein n=1 Tax=Heracleum sosnowskyi TaxID=360622 RepID=A0AAD8H826_9APIA|nr:hypothetical protein POM88_038523 [Heracleum sosnowskyi]